MDGRILVLIILALLFLGVPVLVIVLRYKKCPPDKVMVIFGNVGKDKNGKARPYFCVHGGAAFIWPLIQHFTYLDLNPMTVEAELKNQPTKGEEKADFSAVFTVAVSVEPMILENAAERLVFRKREEIKELAENILYGQIRLFFENTGMEEIGADCNKSMETVCQNAEKELNKVGLWIINAKLKGIRENNKGERKTCNPGS